MEDAIRSSGRTTRLIDKYVQDLFNEPNKQLYIKDHWDTDSSNNDLCNKIIARVHNEHNIILKYNKPNILMLCK